MKTKIESLHSFVPLQGIPEQHLEYLVERVQSHFLFTGSIVESSEFGGDVFIYLFSGEVVVSHADGSEQTVNANGNLLPLAYQHFLPAKISAIIDSELIIFPLDELRKQLCWSQMAEFQRVQIAGDPSRDEDAQWINFILDSNLFFKVPPTNVSEIFSKLTPKVVSSGDTVVRQGEIGNACFFIKEGQARVDVIDPETNTQKTVAYLGPGRCFGEDALVNKTQRNATVTMIENGVLMRLSKDDFFPLMKKESSDQVSSDLILSSLNKLDSKHRYVLIDVRTAPEYEFGHLKNSVNISLDLLPLHIPRLDKGIQYVLYSDTAFRSDAGASALSKLGFNAMSLAEGLRGLISKSEKELVPLHYLTTQSYWLHEGSVIADQSSGTIK